MVPGPRLREKLLTSSCFLSRSMWGQQEMFERRRVGGRSCGFKFRFLSVLAVGAQLLCATWCGRQIGHAVGTSTELRDLFHDHDSASSVSLDICRNVFASIPPVCALLAEDATPSNSSLLLPCAPRCTPPDLSTKACGWPTLLLDNLRTSLRILDFWCFPCITVQVPGYDSGSSHLQFTTSARTGSWRRNDCFTNYRISRVHA